MKILTTLCAFLASVALTQAAIIEFDLTVGGLTGLNEVPSNGSPATGGEIDGGITYNSDTKTLTLNIGYGSLVGFTDLFSTYKSAHIHNGAVGANGPVVFDLAANHIPLGFDKKSGLFLGSVNYGSVPGAEADLFAGLHYINIHTDILTAGEIRGQLTPLSGIPEPMTTALVAGLGLLGFAAYRRIKAS